VVAETPHGAGLTLDACPSHLIQFFGLDEGEGDVSVQRGIVGQLDLLLTTLPEELLDLVAAAGKRGGLRGGWFSGFRCFFDQGLATFITEPFVWGIYVSTQRAGYLRA
jgi:hypothetical protein